MSSWRMQLTVNETILSTNANPYTILMLNYLSIVTNVLRVVKDSGGLESLNG